MLYLLANVAANVVVGFALTRFEMAPRVAAAVVVLTVALNVVGFDEAVRRAAYGPPD